MELVLLIIDFVLHIDRYLSVIIRDYGVLTYSILFLIVFLETGLVVTPFLPGDSLLFAAGALAAMGSLNIALLIFLLILAAILGDTVNYAIGNYLGPKVFDQDKVRFLKKEYLQRTHEFYEKHGGKTIIIARFIPIIRTFAPFVAGIGSMTYRHFVSYNVIGGVVWVFIFCLGGYFFGNLPAVRRNFSLVLLMIIIISVLPGVIEIVRQAYQKKRSAKQN